jgi:hypothetical protein
MYFHESSYWRVLQTFIDRFEFWLLDINNGCGRFEVSGFVEGSNGLGCVAGVSHLFERTSV